MDPLKTFFVRFCYKEPHIDDLVAHRSDDPKALRRYRTQPQTNEKLLNCNTHKELSPKKQYDHSPHEVFVQLDELQGNLEEWKETARWIKYEEDVEEGSDRWGRPHVAPLSFHSLLNLRLFLEQGVVLLDLEERDFPGISYKIIEMVIVLSAEKLFAKNYIKFSVIAAGCIEMLIDTCMLCSLLSIYK